jgi:hypothetical protein
MPMTLQKESFEQKGGALLLPFIGPGSEKKTCIKRRASIMTRGLGV